MFNIVRYKMYEILIAIVLIIVSLYLWSWRKTQVHIRQCPPGVLFTYQKVVGSSGHIYDLDIRTDGVYAIYSIKGKHVIKWREGVLDNDQYNAYRRLLYNPPKSCLYPDTVADSIITQIIYRHPSGPKVVYLGVLDQHALPHGVFNDVVTLDKLINVIA
jgi:hypothetical protein